jgi:hypothetical protein
MSDTNTADQKQAPKRGRPRLTHCWRGHDLADATNIRILRNGHRQCRACVRINQLERYHERRRGR